MTAPKEQRVYLPKHDVTVISNPTPETLRPKGARLVGKVFPGESTLQDSEGVWAYVDDSEILAAVPEGHDAARMDRGLPPSHGPIVATLTLEKGARFTADEREALGNSIGYAVLKEARWTAEVLKAMLRQPRFSDDEREAIRLALDTLVTPHAPDQQRVAATLRAMLDAEGRVAR